MGIFRSLMNPNEIIIALYWATVLVLPPNRVGEETNSLFRDRKTVISGPEVQG